VHVLDEAASYETTGRDRRRLRGPRRRRRAGDAARPHAAPSARGDKALAADLPHKSDVGGVRLGISGPDELRAAAEGIAAATAGHGIPIGRVLVQEMISGLGEAMVGVRRDPDAGLVTVVAAGGTFAELYADRAVHLGRLDHTAARSMIDEVRALSVLRGYRGGPVGDPHGAGRRPSSPSRTCSRTTRPSPNSRSTRSLSSRTESSPSTR